MSRTPTPAPRKVLAPKPTAAPRQPGQSTTGNVTVETEEPDQKAVYGSHKSPPPRPPPPQSQSGSQDGKHNQEKTMESAKHMVTVTTEDETTNKSFGKPRKLPPTPDTKSYLFVDNKVDAASYHGESSTAADQINPVGDGNKPARFHRETGTVMADQLKKSIDGNTLAASQDKEHAGKTRSIEDGYGEMSKSFIQAWSHLNIEIQCQGRKSIKFDATDMFGPPVLLQFALTAEGQKDISLDSLRKQCIIFEMKKDKLIFTYPKEKQYWSEQDFQDSLVNILLKDIVDGLAYKMEKKDTETGLAVLESIKKLQPAVLRRGEILIFYKDADLFVVGTERNIQHFNHECECEETKTTDQIRDGTKLVLVTLSNLSVDEIDFITNLELSAEIESAIPDVKFSIEHKTIQGKEQNVERAVEMLNNYLSSVAKKEVVFKDPFCAKAFLDKNSKNKVLCDFATSQVYECKTVAIKKCFIEVSAGETPRILIYCMSQEQANAAAGIVFGCLHMNKIGKYIFTRIKEEIRKWFDRRQLYLVHSSEKELFVVTTCDITEKFNMLIAGKMDITKQITIPDLVFKYLSQYGASLIEKVFTEYKVSVNLSENAISLSGIPDNVTKAKKFIKESYAGECVNVETDISEINKQAPQIDTLVQKHKCCWIAKPNDRDRMVRIKDVQYIASWCNPPTSSKLTVVEGVAGNMDFDVLLVFVTDSLFPIISRPHLLEGYERFICFNYEELRRHDGDKISLGTLGQVPQHVLKDFIKSKDVMYLVVQKSTEIEGNRRHLPLPVDLVEKIQKACYGKELTSIGIPIEIELQGCIKESELCEQISEAWINNWCQLKSMPELFLCSTATSGKAVAAVDETLKFSRGFSRQSFSTFREDISDASDFVRAEVKIGDLLNSEADVIVNTTAKNLDLREGYISSLILKHAGVSVQEDCNKLYPEGIEHAEVAVTGSGNLRQTTPIKHILHSSLEHYRSKKHDQAINCVKRFIKNCLCKAERLPTDVTSIAFPALGTGRLQYPVRDVAATMFDAVEEYFGDAIRPRIRHVYFMLYEGDKTVCQVFQNEDWRRKEQSQGERKELTSSENEILKKTIPMVEGAIDFKVFVNIQCVPSQFVVVNFNHVEPGKETHLILKSAKGSLPSLNDELVSCQNIVTESDLRRMVKEVIIKTDQEKVTGLAFFPVTKSSFKCSVGQQIKWFTAEVESLTKSYMEPREKLLKYLREIWFPVDESGFSSAESCLMSGAPGRFLNSITNRSSWEKIPGSEASHRASINVIGPSRDAVQTAATEMRAILKQEKSSGKSQEKQLSSTEVLKHRQGKVYASLGFENQQHSLLHSNPEMKKNRPIYPQKDETGTEDEGKQTFMSQGARPKQTGVPSKSNIVPSGPLKTGADRQDSIDKDSSLLDTLEVTAEINHGITSFMKAKGEDDFTEWTEKVTKVFQVHFQKRMDKLTVHGSFFQIKAFQDYLNNDFPKFPEEPKDAEYDDSKSPDDTAVESPLVTNSEDGIVFQYQIGNFNVFVYKGDLTHVNTDCIVSSASLYLKGNWGLEKFILDAAGRKVRQECETYIKQKKELLPGETFVTCSGNLRCKKIIHFAVPGSLNIDGERKLYTTFLECLNEAEKHRFHSAAIPALGSGSFTASSSVRLVEKFGTCFYNALSTSSEKKDLSVKVVHFVDKSHKMVSSVVRAMPANFTCLRINKATIYFTQGNVTATKADAIVVFQDSDFNFYSKIANAVAALSGDRYPLTLETLKDQEPCIGSVYRSKTTGDMANLCASIIHAIITKNIVGDTKEGLPTVTQMRKTCENIFEKCQKLNVTTIGVPVFEIEELNNKEYFNAMAEFVFEYFCIMEEPSIKEIHFLSEDKNAVRTFIECLLKQIEQVEQLKKENKLAFHSAPKQETEIYLII